MHCERQARALIESDPEGGTVEVQGELLTQQYFDGLAKEVDEMLQVWGCVGGSVGMCGEVWGCVGGEVCEEVCVGEVFTEALRLACSRLPPVGPTHLFLLTNRIRKCEPC